MCVSFFDVNVFQNSKKMTKLRSKLQQLAKKRAHRKTVQKRKVDRAAKDILAKKTAEQIRLEEQTNLEMERLANPELDAGEDPQPSTLADGLIIDKKLVASIVMPGRPSGPALKKGAKKQLTRKQLKRKEKGIEKGSGIADQMNKKWNVKKMRVKVRAQVRNENLH
ncbi:Hypothetical protein, putative [Bodo saltans]|uniref:Uncharacterized protein n=1 Tax=Bodo saltans TaxID=75058 RepID=A0A0S4JBT2_BODSA|nr:Hypothetical protein, putative [Bodo saltans]|eukprot:CUG88963.1 Hypothetical protein, putative [Bodo saltans]